MVEKPERNGSACGVPQVSCRGNHTMAQNCLPPKWSSGTLSISLVYLRVPACPACHCGNSGIVLSWDLDFQITWHLRNSHLNREVPLGSDHQCSEGREILRYICTSEDSDYGFRNHQGPVCPSPSFCFIPPRSQLPPFWFPMTDIPQGFTPHPFCQSH